MTEWMDASILDESDPTKRDPELDLYNPDNPNQPPYTAGVPGALPPGADRPQPANHQVGQGEARRAEGQRTARRRVRVRRARHHGRPALAGPDRRPQRPHPRHLLSGRPSGGEHEPGRAGAVLHAAQLAVAVELRRRQRRRRQGRARHRGARTGDRQPRRRRLHARATPGGCSRRSGIPTRRCTKSPAPTTITPARTSATRCARPSASAPTGCIGTGSR